MPGYEEGALCELVYLVTQNTFHIADPLNADTLIFQLVHQRDQSLWWKTLFKNICCCNQVQMCSGMFLAEVSKSTQMCLLRQKISGKPKGLAGYCSRCGMHMYPSINVDVQLYTSLCMTELDFGKAWVGYNLQILDQAIEEEICPEMSITYLFQYIYFLGYVNSAMTTLERLVW